MSRKFTTVIRMGASAYDMKIESKAGNLHLDFSKMTPKEFVAATRSFVSHYRREYNEAQVKQLRSRKAQAIDYAPGKELQL